MRPLSSRSPWQRSILLLVVSGWAAGCGGEAARPDGPVSRDSAGVLIQEFPAGVLTAPASIGLPPVPQLRIGVVEGAPEYQWTRPVAAARLSDGGFAVLEQVPPEVRLFDPAGGFLGRVGSEGEGPGELRSPVGMAVLPGDTILVWDRGLQRLSWFSREGALAREQTVRQPGEIRTLRRVALTSSGAVVVLGATTTVEELGNQGRIREAWQVVRIDPSDEGGTVLGTVPGTERAIEVQSSPDGEVISVNVQGRWWWGEGFSWPSEQGVWTADRLSLEARHFDLDRGADRIVRVMAPDRPFTNALIDSLHRAELERVTDPEIRALWQSDFEGRQYPAGVPPVAGVFSDLAARVWIGLTDPPPERLPSGEWTAIRRWLVFEESAPGQPEGARSYRALGVLTLPPRSHPLWADGHGVLLVRADADLDVAFVEWYPFVEG